LVQTPFKECATMTPALAKRRDELAEEHWKKINEEFTGVEMANMPYTLTDDSFKAGFDECAKIHADVVAAAKSILADNRLMNAMSREQARGLMYARSRIIAGGRGGDVSRKSCADCGTRIEKNGVCPNCDEAAFIEDWQHDGTEETSEEFQLEAAEGRARAKARLEAQ